eukprot:2242677-Rhodomonas_salina.2
MAEPRGRISARVWLFGDRRRVTCLRRDLLRGVRSWAASMMSVSAAASGGGVASMAAGTHRQTQTQTQTHRHTDTETET